MSKGVLSFFLLWSRFFYFPNVFYLKNVAKVQSGKQINKKHFQNNSNEIDLLDHAQYCKTNLNGIFRVALKAISWASGVELNYTNKR